MEINDNKSLDELFLEELQIALNLTELHNLPQALVVQQENTPNLDRWRERK